MTDRPIIFSAPMVRALLDGRKTKTRRLATSPLRKCEVGDRLYVRESGIYFPGVEGGSGELFRHDVPIALERGEYWSRNNGGPGASYMLPACSRKGALASNKAAVRPSIHMPRWASRLTLIVEGMKIEPLQVISQGDAIAEGVHLKGPLDCDASTWAVDLGEGRRILGTHPEGVYRRLWDNLHTAEGERWDDNPDVVALTFSVVRGNIDQVPA